MICSNTAEILLSSHENSYDVGSGGAEGKSDLITSNRRCIAVKNTLGSVGVVSCACELILLLYVVLFVVTTVHKFEVTFVIN
jgi:hypothetical protein